MDRNEPQWRTNSSFSPPLPRRWDHRFQRDGISHVTIGVPTYGSSASSHSRGSRIGISGEQYLNHHHSVSDGALSYFGSPSENAQAPRWMPPVQKYDLGEFSTPTGGARSESFVYARGNERHFPAGFSSLSSSLGSPSPFSESGQLASTSKHPILFTPRNFSNRCSFMSKPVYPLSFRNPVSDGETYGTSGPGIGSSVSQGSTFSPDFRFQKSLTHLQKMEASLDPDTSSSRREGFRWSNASSYEFGFDGDGIDVMEHIGIETSRSPYSSSITRQHKCGLCQRPLWQKSPWSSQRVVRNTDMPVAGVLPCHHIFHAECLEETTPKSQLHEPPCPFCSKSVGSEACISFSEPLQVVLRSVLRSQGGNAATDGVGSSSNPNLDRNESGTRHNQSLPPMARRSSFFKRHLKKRFSFKGKTGKDLFGPNMSRNSASSSSSLLGDNNQIRPGPMQH